MKLSISRIKLFKACRRAYELKYLEGLEPVAVPESLQTGLSYHARIERLYKTGRVDTSDFSKESAMAVAYMKYIYPKFRVKIVEGWLSMELESGDELIGRMDGMAEDGHLVEHKITSGDITEEYEYNLQWDEQMLAYMLMSGSRKIWYTVCRKPTIRQKGGESDEDFFRRMVRWYDEDTDSKIRVMLISRTDEEVNRFKRELEQISSEMSKAYEDNVFYRNTCHCKCWGRQCEYASVCLNDRNADYIEFTREGR